MSAREAIFYHTWIIGNISYRENDNDPPKVPFLKLSYLLHYFHLFLNCDLISAGYGHIVPMTSWGRIFCIVYALFGIPLTCVFFKSVGTKINDRITKLISVMKKKFLRRESEHLKAAESALVAIFLDIFTLFLISLVASLRRKDWNYLESFYFCFITFSTIGLGDFLPFEDASVGASEYLLMAVGVILGFSMMSTMLCALGQAFEEATHLQKVDPLVTATQTDGRKTDLKTSTSQELVDIEQENEL